MIAAALVLRLLAEAAESPALEVCGLLLGSGSRVDEARASRNVAADPARMFELDPAALIAAHKAARAGGPAILGHYHSHPSGSAAPSPRDLAAATPGQLWLILGGGTARLWLARAGGFDELPLETG
jgi:desampylase